jgi:hypothetical protein
MLTRHAPPSPVTRPLDSERGEAWSADLCKWALALTGGLLVFIATVQALLSLLTLFQPWEVEYGEAIVYDQAARLVRGEPLYQPLDRPPYAVAAYTPLYYVLAGGLQATFGPGFAPGRALSFIAGLAAASLVGYLTRRATASRRAGAFAALLFLSLGLPHLWSALYRVDTVGVALALGAIVMLVGGDSTRRVVLAGLLAALAFLTKQTLVTPALAGTIWLWCHNRRMAAIFLGACLALVISVGLVLEGATGAFLANAAFANLNPTRFDVLQRNVAALILLQGGPLTVTVLSLKDGWRRWLGGELLIMYWVAAAIPLVGLAKVGSNHNYWIELAAITAVLATIGCWSRFGELRVAGFGRRALVPVLLLAITILPNVQVAAASLQQALGGDALSRGRRDAFQRLVERVASEPRLVLAGSLDAVVLAGRPILLEPYIFSILYSQGQWEPGPLVQRICAGDVGLLLLPYPLEAGGEDGPGLHGYAGWPAPILGALRQVMRLEAGGDGGYLYVPRGSSSSLGCEGQAL